MCDKKAQKSLDEATEYCPSTTFKKLSTENVLLLDVRENDEIAQIQYDVPNLLHIPLSELEKRFAEVPKDQPVISACLGGQRSLKATYFLMYQGYTNVANMAHGLKRWIAKDLPVKGDQSDINAIKNAGEGGCCCSH